MPLRYHVLNNNTAEGREISRLPLFKVFTTVKSDYKVTQPVDSVSN